MRQKRNNQLGTSSRSTRPRAAALNTVAAAVAGILYCAGGAYAADETPAASDEGNALNEIVVTASAQGVKKLDASYNIVSLSLDDIKNSNPASVADIFKLSPGIWPEASGGQTGVNIDVAGFPNGGGDSPYFLEARKEPARRLPMPPRWRRWFAPAPGLPHRPIARFEHASTFALLLCQMRPAFATAAVLRP